MKSARFFALDARAAFPFLLVLLHFTMWTLALAGISSVLFLLAERLGLKFEAALRAVRCWFVVPMRPAVPFQLKRRMSDMSGPEALQSPAPPPAKPAGKKTR
jgi:intracellular multiplication protein IcmT